MGRTAMVTKRRNSVSLIQLLLSKRQALKEADGSAEVRSKGKRSGGED